MTAGGVRQRPGEYELKLTAADPDSTLALPGTTGLISLDTSVTPELAAEGTARDVVRVIQQARKDAGLAVSDRIALRIGVRSFQFLERMHESFGDKLPAVISKVTFHGAPISATSAL